jgi:hypothetical protein
MITLLAACIDVKNEHRTASKRNFTVTVSRTLLRVTQYFGYGHKCVKKLDEELTLSLECKTKNKH